MSQKADIDLHWVSHLCEHVHAPNYSEQLEKLQELLSVNESNSCSFLDSKPSYDFSQVEKQISVCYLLFNAWLSCGSIWGTGFESKFLKWKVWGLNCLDSTDWHPSNLKCGLPNLRGFCRWAMASNTNYNVRSFFSPCEIETLVSHCMTCQWP